MHGKDRQTPYGYGYGRTIVPYKRSPSGPAVGGVWKSPGFLDLMLRFFDGGTQAKTP